MPDFYISDDDLKALRKLADGLDTSLTAALGKAVRDSTYMKQYDTPPVDVGPFCDRPPVGWRCTREPGHDGPCAASPETAVPAFPPRTVWTEADSRPPVQAEPARSLRPPPTPRWRDTNGLWITVGLAFALGVLFGAVTR